jgi:hypothetical protein
MWQRCRCGAAVGPRPLVPLVRVVSMVLVVLVPGCRTHPAAGGLAGPA